MLPVAPGGHRAAAELAEARLERVARRLERGQHVGQPLAAGVVEVRGQLDLGAERLAGGAEELAHLERVGHAGGVAEADLLRAASTQPARRSRRPARAARGPRRGSRSVEITASQRRPASRAAASRARARLSDSSIERLTFLRLCVSDALRKTLISSKRSRWRARCRDRFSLGISTETGRRRARSMRLEHLARRRRAAGSRRRARSS